ncbi:MAG: hypothetical protein GW795_13450 [Cyanobacteria bacterium]|nr:hypothetical protein [Cyanobacteria bacterium CG_2015-16_32_12]NCO77538.1 hypothetical protein [Cyanobacteria bacterium CG_2015-22_32_23]NCQ05729.1 hypothetical protein [Cyanobacteria bacterium CG_2015-09_32_10]NCQ42844.1 hypothetical protein [Cyanobacteria bacterium CG_2015-04_32_10]NCS84314.1 hypothetical protein [Cyanobacteria bacterium CG_2015-02_32_10]
MKEYLNSLQSISTLIEQVKSNTDSSIELNNSAEILNNSLQPCYQEYQASLTKLKFFHEVCLENIENAYDVWQSKFRIEDIPKTEIIQQLGEFSSCDCRIWRLKQINQTEFLAQLNQSWEENFTTLEKKWFFESNKNTLRNSTNMFEKDGLIKDLINLVDTRVSGAIENIVENGLIVIKDELFTLDLDKFETTISLLDSATKEKVRDKKNNLLARIYDYCSEGINTKTNDYKTQLKSYIDDLNKKSLMGVNLENFQKFKVNISSSINDFINKIFDELNNRLIDVIEEGIKFYNNLLEKQKSYEEETEEKRNSEKQWLDSQKHEFQMIQDNINNILAILT